MARERCSPIEPGWRAEIRGCWLIWPSGRAGPFSPRWRGGNRLGLESPPDGPWRLTNIEMAGGHDLFVAGRPAVRLPGTTVAGRGTHRGRQPGGLSTSRDGFQSSARRTATQTIKREMDQALPSEAAWPRRTFRPGALSQLEASAPADAAAEPVATAYADTSASRAAPVRS